MTSGTSFKNQLRETAKNRIWQLAVVLLFLFITLPMSAAALITKRPDFTAESGISESIRKSIQARKAREAAISRLEGGTAHE